MEWASKDNSKGWGDGGRIFWMWVGRDSTDGKGWGDIRQEKRWCDFTYEKGCGDFRINSKGWGDLEFWKDLGYKMGNG